MKRQTAPKGAEGTKGDGDVHRPQWGSSRSTLPIDWEFGPRGFEIRKNSRILYFV